MPWVQWRRVFAWRAINRFGRLQTFAVSSVFLTIFSVCGLLIYGNHVMSEKQIKSELFAQTITISRMIGTIAEQKLAVGQLTEIDAEFRAALLEFSKSAHIAHGVIHDVRTGLSLEFDSEKTEFYANDVWFCVAEVLETGKDAAYTIDDQMSVAVPIHVNGEMRGAVSVMQTKDFLNNGRREAVVRTSMIAGGLCIILIPIMLVFISRLFKPIRALTHAARRLEHGLDVSDIASASRHDEIGTLARAFQRMARTIQAKSVEERRLANVDSVTGLANRARAEKFGRLMIENFRKNNKPWALCFIDLDKFKQVNDTLGHDLGDRILQKAAHLIESTCQEQGYHVVGPLDSPDVLDNDLPLAGCARFGGDEFVLLLRSATQGESTPAELAHAIISKVQQPFFVDSHVIDLGVSIGVALLPEHATDPALLLRYADLAMYAAKSQGGGCYRLYNDEMSDKALDRRLIEMELRRAIGQHEIIPYYMPKIRFSDGQICGFEALARWHHPHKGMIMPDRFIPVAEDMGLVTDIDRIILRKAAEQTCRWWKQGIEMPIAVNVSPPHVERRDFADFVERVVKETGVPPHLIELEFTETAAMSNSPEVLEMVTRLKKLGLRFAIDDFGTGYSNLAQLRRLPVDVLKIDRSLVRNIGSDADADLLIQTIIAMTKQMKLEIVVEGVETPAQSGILKALGCTYAQGYLYGAPKSIEETANLLAPLLQAPRALRLVG